jgi:hypothetical protein
VPCGLRLHCSGTRRGPSRLPLRLAPTLGCAVQGPRPKGPLKSEHDLSQAPHMAVGGLCSKGPFKWEGGTTAMYVANVPSQGGRATSPPPHLRWRPTSQRQVGGGGPTSAPNVPTSGGNVQRQRGTWYVPRHAGTRTHLTQRVSSRPAPPRDEPLWALRRAPGGGCSPTEHSVSNGL